MAGIYYGENGIPAGWVAGIARNEDIRALGVQLNELLICSPTYPGSNTVATSISGRGNSNISRLNLVPSRKRKPSGFTVTALFVREEQHWSVLRVDLHPAKKYLFASNPATLHVLILMCVKFMNELFADSLNLIK